MLWEAMGHRHTGTHWAPAVCHVLSVPTPQALGPECVRLGRGGHGQGGGALQAL